MALEPPDAGSVPVSSPLREGLGVLKQGVSGAPRTSRIDAQAFKELLGKKMLEKPGDGEILKQIFLK